jgi:Holliday junction resolvasome RuvABC endonuclease subunit
MIVGFDLSLNHAGAIALDEHGEIAGHWFISDKKGAVDRGGKGVGFRSVTKKKGIDPEKHQLDRMNFFDRWFWHIVKESSAEFAGVEGYAFAAVSNSSYQYGELGGLARRVLTRAGCKLRIHDPLSVKMFATGKGNAKTPELLEIVPGDDRDAWLDIEVNLKGQQVAEDLGVAYWIARLVFIEVELRAGRFQLNELDEKRVRVFNRVTKTYPVNLLDRDWLER